ncbi:MAG: DUF1987 domain-containing protein [Salinivirgaceae bacterium]|jgi:hypothetical protein|nr:DUF1987 domain-containing protein [Salinivirgaceae bacterium]
MEPLIIEPTDESPEIILDKENGRFEFGGKSMPEDVKEFFGPIHLWLEEYAKEPNDETYVKFKFEYFNSASAKQILDILAFFEKVKEAGKEVKIDWYFLDDDEDMEEAGESYGTLVELPINLVAY